MRCERRRKISRVKLNGIKEMTNPRGVVRMGDVVERKEHDKGDFIGS